MEDWERLLALPVVTLRTQLVPRDFRALEERWWASTIRGGLGRALRFLLCRCRERSHLPGCVFARLFAPAAEEGGDSGMLPPWRLTVNVADSHLQANFRLFGEATEFTEAFLLALESAAFRGLGRQRFRVTVLGKDETAFERLAPDRWDSNLTLELKSPVRLQERGTIITQAPSFSQVFASAQRKVRLAARSWCGVELSFPQQQMYMARHVTVASASVRWVEMGRYSQRQQRFMRLGGLQGALKFAGEWSFAWPWLRFLPALGLGKLTTMGFGEVAWEPTPEA
ncbi:hypothetical protein EG19_07915 [Thermoanaerobaculum aquaticum]|nr:CRISPR system precrRNA processing endoribonuclease RAMP protein Cas6 [Thermoanaerobaculum aquaticum]KDA53030.1 hypothetical protein EG19_07915 [Thermoanaerobaculum aquaticum]